MFAKRRYMERFDAILAELDELTDACDGDAAEALEDLNAEFDDALILLGEIKPEGEDGREEVSGVLDDLAALANDYRAAGAGVEGVGDLANRLEATANKARESLDDE